MKILIIEDDETLAGEMASFLGGISGDKAAVGADGY